MTALASAITVALIAAALALLAAAAGGVIVSAVRKGGRREEPGPAHEALSISRFTIPVSVVVPITGDSPSPTRVVDDLLRLAYPELEIIVVAEGVSWETLGSLATRWRLEPREFFYRYTLSTGEVHRIFRSPDDGRLMMVEKAPGGRADAVNCGANLARLRYLTVIAPDLFFEPDALLRVMSPALLDPGHVVAATSHVERRPSDSQAPDPQTTAGFWTRLAARGQQLASLRAIMEASLLPARFRQGPSLHDGVTVWRRDAFLEAGGLRSEAVDPEFELMLRLSLSPGQGGGVVLTGETFGHARTLPMGKLMEATARRQAASLGSVGSWGAHGAEAHRYFIGRELVLPAAEAFIVGALIAGTASGWLSVAHLITGVLTLTMGTAAVTSAALLTRGASARASKVAEFPRLLWVGPLEFVVLKPALAIARAKGAWSVLVSRTIGTL